MIIIPLNRARRGNYIAIDQQYCTIPLIPQTYIVSPDRKCNKMELQCL